MNEPPVLTRLLAALADLVLPLECGGCTRPGVNWCDECDAVVSAPPIEIRLRVELPVGVWAAGRYRGPLRRAVIELKERGRVDLVDPLGTALASTLTALGRCGELPDRDRLVLVPAPTRLLAALRRGGDPVTAMAEIAAARIGSGVFVIPAVRTRSTVRDSAGLTLSDRSRNMAGGIRFRRINNQQRQLLLDPSSAVVVVDDVITTGTTAAHTIAVLRGAGITVDAVVVVSAV